MANLYNLSVLLLVLLTGATATYYQDCGSQDKINSFVLSNCPDPPCIVERPSVQYVNISFVSASDAESLDTEIIANIGGQLFPFPGPGGCDLLIGEQCPLREGTAYFYSARMPVLAEYPAVEVLVTWRLVDENDRLHFCGKVEIELI